MSGSAHGLVGARRMGAAFEIVLAVAGWIAVAAAYTTLPPVHGPRPLLGALLFLSVCAGARLFAFPLSGLVRGLPPSSVLSLDAAVLVAGAVSVGAPYIAPGLGLILGADFAVRATLRRRRAPSESVQQRRHAIVREAVYTGGVAGGLLVLSASLFRAHLAEPTLHAWLVPALGVVFLAAHAGLQVLHARVSARSASRAR
jgi:hypothetical protein